MKDDDEDYCDECDAYICPDCECCECPWNSPPVDDGCDCECHE